MTGVACHLRSYTSSLACYGMDVVMSERLVGYSHGMLSLAGRELMYVAAVVYWGSVDRSTPMNSGPVKKGDPPETDA